MLVQQMVTPENPPIHIKKEINQRCKFTEFVILDFSGIFYSKKPILKVKYFNDRNNAFDFQYTELTPLRKVGQIIPFNFLFCSRCL